MPQDLTDDKSTLVQVMAWCRQATSHYLNQCWPRSPTPYGVTRPQWVNSTANVEVKAWMSNDKSDSPGGWFNIKMSSFQYRKSHCGDKTILRPSYLHNGISYAGKMTFLYWIRAQVYLNVITYPCLKPRCWFSKSLLRSPGCPDMRQA